MRIPGPSRRLKLRVERVFPRYHQADPERSVPRGGPSWVGLHEPPVGHGPTGSSGRQPEPGAGVRGMSTAAGPGGGAALVGASVVPPPTFPPPEPTPAATTDSCEQERPVNAGHYAQLPALIATLPSPGREIVLLRVVAGVSIPDIVAVLGVTPAAVSLAQHEALGALQPASTANGPPPAAREQVVLLPHTWTETTDNRLNNRRTGRVKGVKQDNSPRQHPTQRDGTTRTSTANMQWHDAELAMRVARHSFDSWRAAGHDDTSSPAVMHAYHTHTALHEAARVITVLIETFRVEATTLIATPVHGTDIPTQRR